LCASEEVDQKMSADKMKYKLISRTQNAGQNHNIKTAVKSFENVVDFNVPRNDVNR
jgi:hypothetical protein